jgi:hyaluronan synthase
LLKELFMESFSVEPASRSAVFPHAGEETPTWLSVDLRFVIAAVVVLGAVAATTIRFSHEVFDPLADALKIQGWAAIIARPSLLWFTMGTVLIVIRTLLWVRYRPVAAASPDEAPRMSIIIPAYNEGMMIRKAVDACARAEYPRDRLEIIVIDDGSTDDTWTHVDAAQRERADLV